MLQKLPDLGGRPLLLMATAKDRGGLIVNQLKKLAGPLGESAQVVELPGDGHGTFVYHQCVECGAACGPGMAGRQVKVISRTSGATMTQEPFLPIAVWYTGGNARATMVRPPGADSPVKWKQDLQTIKDCGFNAVRCWVDWASGEPAPGEYHFETLDLLMDLSEEVGIKVICQLYLDSAPDWLATLYPDCRYVSAGGVAVDSQGAPGYCYDNPGVHAAAKRFMIALASRLAPRPTFLAWDLGASRTSSSGAISITCRSPPSSATATTRCSASAPGSSKSIRAWTCSTGRGIARFPVGTSSPRPSSFR